MLRAIIVVEPEIRAEEEISSAAKISARQSLGTLSSQGGTPLVCVDALGFSVVSRLIEDLRRVGLNDISVSGNVSSALVGLGSASSVNACAGEDAWRAAERHLRADSEGGAESVLLVRVGAYVDLDLKDFFQFHREQKLAVTRASDKDGPLDLWIIEPAGIPDGVDLRTALQSIETAEYLLSGYVNRLQHPRDLRRLVVDSFMNRCRLRPLGTESRPGVWIDEGAQVHRDSRIVAPAFIGRGARIGEQCLITRCSNIESNCQIDYGTVVEDSSILSNSYVGIGLDLSHSIVDGNNLMNLERGVTLEIVDPCVIRQNRAPRHEKNFKLPATFGRGGVHFSQVEVRSR